MGTASGKNFIHSFMSILPRSIAAEYLSFPIVVRFSRSPGTARRGGKDIIVLYYSFSSSLLYASFMSSFSVCTIMCVESYWLYSSGPNDYCTCEILTNGITIVFHDNTRWRMIVVFSCCAFYYYLLFSPLLFFFISCLL